MSSHRSRLGAASVLAAAVLLSAGVAAARSVPERATSLGAQIRASSLVAVGTFAEGRLPPAPTGRALRLTIESVLMESVPNRGGVRVDALVRHEPGLPLPPLERRVLVFLVTRPGSEEGAFRLALGPWSVIPLPAAGKVAPALELARAQASFLADGGPDEEEEAAYRSLLVRAAAGDDALTGRSALLDLTSAPDLVEDLTARDAENLLKRFGTLPARDGRRPWIVRVLGMARVREAALPFANALAQADGRVLRPEIAATLRAIDDDVAAARVLALRGDGDARLRADAISVLGRWGRPAFRETIEGALEDADAGVREEALVALGRMGRGDSFEALRGAFARAEAFRERRAALWALGRIDRPEGFALVRSVARDEEADARLRRAASRILREPGASYFLD